MRAEGVFDVDANTSIDQLSEDLNIKMPEVHHFFIFFIHAFYILVFSKLTMFITHIGRVINMRRYPALYVKPLDTFQGQVRASR
jgi:hypothetical protein